MNIAFAGFRHSHIYGLYKMAKMKEDIKIIGAFEENDEARSAAKKSLNVQFSYETYNELLNDKKVDAVAIGDYYQKRGKMIIDALKAGKHIITDKPVCTDLSELYEIRRIAGEKNLSVCCMLDLRYMPCARKAKELIEKGEIGDIRIASFTGQHFLDQKNRPGWYFEKGKHGGTINDIAIHGIDLLRYITGKDLSEISFARTWNAFSKDHTDFKDCGQFAIEMENIHVMADISYAAPGYSGILPTYWRFELWGSLGMMSFNYAEKNKVKIYKTDEKIIECKETEDDCLSDLIKEISGENDPINTKSVLLSSEQTLKIQEYADRKDQ